MFLALLFFVSVILFLLFYTSVKWNSKYWKKQNIPSVGGIFFYGNFKAAFWGEEHFGLVYKKYYDKYVHDSPFVGLFKLRQPMLLMCDLGVIQNVLVGNFASFYDTEFQADSRTDPIWASNPITIKGEAWKKSRSRWVSHLSPAKIKQSYESIINSSHSLVKHINEKHHVDSNKPIELISMVSTFFLDYLISGIFGIHNDSFLNPINTFLEVKNSLFQSSFYNGFISTLFVVAPPLRNILPFRFVSEENEKKLLNVSKEIMKCRKETGKPDSDIYDALQKYSQADGLSDFSPWHLAGRLFGLILDGSETTSHPACFGLYELACNSDVQNKLREEVDSLCVKNSEEISYEEIIQLQYLDMVVAEVLRLYPALTHLSRVCTRDILLKSNYVSVIVNKGIPVIIPVYAIHHDPQYYPDPYKFDPERFAPGAREHIPKFAYMPFGEGPRICAGMKVGLLEIKVLLFTLIRNFIISPECILPRPVEFEPNFFVARSKTKLSLYFTPINKE